ncbi:hypothetical protein U9M48_023006 [Paspalum notatum var. saurae]|uniref:Uncharacterized protein n=1 Tax=Paspalum notatum var. saurae TaxID=547442 RepID=A0AAQ3WVA6_PASNO
MLRMGKHCWRRRAGSWLPRLRRFRDLLSGAAWPFKRYECDAASPINSKGSDFEFMINSKGSSPAEMLGPGYKTVLKPALMSHAEESKRIAITNLKKSDGLQMLLQGNVKLLEERNNISSLQDEHDKIFARLNSMDHGITNDDSRCRVNA